MRSIASVLNNRRCASVHEALHRAFQGSGYCSPGLWAALAVSSRQQGLNCGQVLEVIGEQNTGYGKAIGIEAAIGAADTYHLQRSNQGLNYSPLVVLDAEERTNAATRDIAGCVRTWFDNEPLRRFAQELCDVVGDLHDNVWSHAKSTGISMAQKWREPSNDDNHLEFSLADAGYGFLRELTRAGVAQRLAIQTPTEAINWCVVRGNSSKIKDEDPWTQRLPEDAMGNPMGAIGRIRTKENNHLGLGLAKLVDLVVTYRGQLWLASDDAMLTIDSKGGKKCQVLPFPWPGVLLSCRFSTSTVDRVMRGQRPAVDDIDKLLESLLQG